MQLLKDSLPDAQGPPDWWPRLPITREHPDHQRPQSFAAAQRSTGEFAKNGDFRIPPRQSDLADLGWDPGDSAC